MTFSRKLLGLVLLACFALSALIGVGVMGVGTYTAVAVEATDVDHYYYEQLTDVPKEFYKAMEEMLVKEIFIKGEDYDLVASNHVTQAQLEAYANGDSTLLDAMGAARDAFYTDYDDVFYVDFEYLSFRVTQDASGTYHAYLGAGRSDTYYLKGFNSAEQINSAIDAYKTELNKIVSAAKSAKATDDEIEDFGAELAAQVAQIRKAHAEIAKKSVYRLESQASEGNSAHVRTPYGTLVVGEALCEGYSRAFKAAMDELNVPCVLINGGYRHTDTQIEEHMWTYVQLVDGNWYAVDMTFDDINLDDKAGKCPIDKFDNSSRAAEDEEFGYYYSEEYFLKGQFVMNVHHELSPYKSAVQYEFTYPTLSMYAVGTEETVSEYIKVVQTPSVQAQNSTDIYISVLIDGEWCGHVAAAAKGYYLLIRYEGNYLPEKIAGGKLTGGDLKTDDEEGSFAAEYSTGYVWGYIYNPTFPEPLYGNLLDDGTYSIIQNESKALGFEVAVTTTPPRDYNNTTDIDKISQMTTFMGDSSVFYARTGFLPVKFGDPNYQPAPHIVRATPTMQSKLIVRSTDAIEVTFEYDQLLELPKDDSGKEMEFQYSVYGMRAGGEIVKGTNAIPISVMKNVTWYSGKLENGVFTNSWIKFSFTPSMYFAHDNVMYMFDFNLVGQNSGKQVNTGSYAAAFSTGYCSLGVPGYNWRIYGQPQLVDADDLSREGWIDSNGNSITNNKDRLALVITDPTSQQEKEMSNLLQTSESGLPEYADKEVSGVNSEQMQNGDYQSFTYNIQLTICKACVIKTGEKVRVSIGFPEGFTYQSWMNGVEFKMYHFIHDDQNNIIGVEEIPITVTEYGLIILVNSFSPFALVAVKTDKVQEADKTVVINKTTGGTAYGDVEPDDINTKTVFKVKEGETRTLKVKANDGYVIESVKIGNKLVMTGSKEMTLPLVYDELDVQNVIEVRFAAQAVVQAEEQRGESGVVQKGENTVVERLKAVITILQNELSLKAGQQIKIEPTVTANGDSTTYQWYKDGEELSGQTNDKLLIRNAQTSDSGKYVLMVTTKSGTNNCVAYSEAVSVTVTEGGNGVLVGVLVAGGLIVMLLVVCVVAIALKKKTPKKGANS